MTEASDENRGIIVDIIDGDIFNAVELPLLVGVGRGVHAEKHIQHGHDTHEREYVEHCRQQIGEYGTNHIALVRQRKAAQDFQEFFHKTFSFNS